MFKKILIFIYLFISLCHGVSNADDKYKILIKINNQIVSNYDVKKEISYLSALNPAILDLPADEKEKIAKESLIREIIKEQEVSKFFDIDYQSPNLTKLTKNLYTRLNINSEEEFKDYLKEFNLDLNYVLKKLAIEINWNRLIYENYKNKISIDKEKIKKNLDLEFSVLKKEKLFLLSEIIFSAESKKEFDDLYKKITDTINEKDFKTAAKIYSSSDTANFGGEIGWMSKNDISEKFYKQIFNLKINEFSKPLKIGSGFLLLNIDDIKEEERIDNLEDKFNSIITKETNKQLNQYSTIYFKKIKKQNSIYED